MSATAAAKVVVNLLWVTWGHWTGEKGDKELGTYKTEGRAKRLENNTIHVRARSARTGPKDEMPGWLWNGLLAAFPGGFYAGVACGEPPVDFTSADAPSFDPDIDVDGYRQFAVGWVSSDGKFFVGFWVSIDKDELNPIALIQSIETFKLPLL